MIEARGKTLAEAIKNGLDQLNLTEEESDITVLDEATKGFWGLGAKPARVLITEKLKRVNRAEEENRIAREMTRKAQAEEKRPDPPAKEAVYTQSEAPRPAEKPAVKTEAPRPAEKPAVKTEAPQPAQSRPQQQQARPVQPRQPRPQRTEGAPQPPRQPQRQQGSETAQKPAPQRPSVEEGAPRQAPQRTRPRPVQLKRAPSTGEETPVSSEAKEYLDGLLKRMDVDIELSAFQNEDGVFVNAKGPDAGTLIGYRGETLDALQYLVSLKINKGEEDYQRVSLDAEDYRTKRAEILVKLANRLAAKAIKTGRKVALEPMNPYERRILHRALQGHPGVKTHSEGVDPYRRVVITPKAGNRGSAD